jgi:hypothetical protein
MKAMWASMSALDQLAIWYGPPPGVFIISMYFIGLIVGRSQSALLYIALAVSYSPMIARRRMAFS